MAGTGLFQTLEILGNALDNGRFSVSQSVETLEITAQDQSCKNRGVGEGEEPNRPVPNDTGSHRIDTMPSWELLTVQNEVPHEWWTVGKRCKL